VLFVLPGDPAQIILGINASPETLAALRTVWDWISRSGFNMAAGSAAC
jgi:hypothetical protein